MNRVESESDRRTDPGTPSQFLQPAIRVKNLRKCFGDQEVVSDVSFDIAQDRGKIHAANLKIV